MNGIILIDKPQGFTSFDVVAVIRKISGQRKAGHTGTLDPNATGVLPVLIGSATKAQDLILNHDKIYEAVFRLGITSDTLDIWGSVTSQCRSNHTKADLLNVLPKFEGEIEQIPPMFSAVHNNGQRLYDLARRGIEIEREKRKVTVYRLKLLSFDENTQEGKIEIECSKGTYIRTLIDDLGKCLGCGAVMTELRRTKACGFSLDDCITLETARQIAKEDELEKYVRSVESMFMQCGYVAVTDAQAKRFSNGGALDIGRTYLARLDVRDKDIYRVRTKDNHFLGLGIVDLEKGLLKIYLHS